MRWVLCAATAVICAGRAKAETIYWTHWTAHQYSTTQHAGHARGIINLPQHDLTVRYRGEVGNPNELGFAGPSWLPATSYAGGTVGNPPIFGNKIVLNGGPSTGIDAIVFARPVRNPLIAIFSLGGDAGAPAKLVFPSTYSISLEAGGPSKEYGGGPIVVTGDVISGEEGNGTIQLNGVFRVIRFVTPLYEYSYSITVGIPQQ